MFGFAGLWDSSTTAEGVKLHSCTIVTMPANKVMSEIHNAKQRMPAILRKEDRETWLMGDQESAFKVLQQYSDELLIARPVSTRVNAPNNNDVSLIETVAA
jgi:putative SOS response-associated peptidase YedK